jgi:hypothetical protein
MKILGYEDRAIQKEPSRFHPGVPITTISLLTGQWNRARRAIMKPLNSFCHLITFLSSITLAAELHAGVQLNENNFDSLTKHGLW